MSSTEMIGRKGKDLVSIPLPRIGIPRLRHGPNDESGVGQGEQGAGKPGDQASEHEVEAELTVDELARILGEELELPRIQPRGDKDAATVRNRYKGVARQGPRSLRHARRTWKAALKRQIAAGAFDPRRPVLVPIKDDLRFRSFVPEKEPRSAAAILYLMDVSGSMGKEQKEIVRSEAFWIDAWLTHNYDQVETRFIVHDAAAREVDRDTFFRIRESGGTLISSAYTLALDVAREHYPPSAWNLYVFHFSDGDNWSTADTKLCIDLLRDKLVPLCNQFAYAQVDSPYGSGQFIKDLRDGFRDDERVVLSRVASRDGILESIRELLGKGR
jgi:uncharacterized sporulation protein YeaH/YhbH (DUF444 family)